MQIHQFVHTLSYGDAISGEVLVLKRLLAEHCKDSKIYSINTHEKLIGETCDYRLFLDDLAQAKKAGEEVALILHYSLGSPLNEIYRAASGIKKVIIYHNLTPATWFAAYNTRVYEDLLCGRDELPDLLAQSDLVLADSEFNKKELVEFSCHSAEVLPLVLDAEKWQVAENPGIASILKGSNKKNILHVGRIAPNKKIEDIVKAFYFYHHKIEKESALWLIGHDIDTELYSFELKYLVRRLQLEDSVHFVGSVADSELKAFYQNSDLYLCASEHEGFCVPLLEAMHFALPIIAYQSSAIPETLRDAGILISEKRPAELAELMNLVLSDQNLRKELREKAKERVSEFSLQAFSNNLERVLLNPLLEESKKIVACSR